MYDPEYAWEIWRLALDQVRAGGEDYYYLMGYWIGYTNKINDDLDHKGYKEGYEDGDNDARRKT